MVKKTVLSAACVLAMCVAQAQKGKLETAWRSLSDYEETLREGKPDPKYLASAKEAIDLALNHEDTKKKVRTHAYKLRISYAQYQFNLQEEMKKLEASEPDKNKRAMMAYGITSLTEFEVAAAELSIIKDLDPKFLETIQAGIASGASALDDDELKFAQATLQMKVEASNIATGKFNAKKYDEAADYFYKTGIMNTILNKTKDTANFYNASIAAVKSKNNDKIIEYNIKMVELGLARPANYISISNAHLAKVDTVSAIDVIRKGRDQFPLDLSLLTEETNLFIARGKTNEALNNLKSASEKDSKNVFLYLFMGNIYDNLANPKDKTGKELPRPSNFEELFKKAEASYLKALENKSGNNEYTYDANYNLGAMYNNYGGMISNRKAEKITDLMRVQKENEEQAAILYKKAIPYLEQALAIKSNDLNCMRALRQLYLKTGNEAKAKEMSDRIQAQGGK